MGWGGGRSRASSHIFQRCVRKERERERGREGERGSGGIKYFYQDKERCEKSKPKQD